MEFTVSRGDLVRELSLSQGVVEKKTTIPILSNVLLEAADDRLMLTATDLELGIQCSCPAKVKKPGAGTIPAKKLLDYVRLLPEAELQIKLLENHWASLVCGRSRTRIAGMSRENFPELPSMPDRLLDIPAQMVTSMVDKTIFAISNEESRFTLNGALLLFKPDSVVMVATDGHRLSMVEYPMDVPPEAAGYRGLVPKKAMQELVKLVPDGDGSAQLQFSGDENHLFFRLGERLLISRKLTGNFPDYERVLPREHPHQVTLARDEMRAAIERVSQFADERSKAIRLQFTEGEMKFHSSLSDTGESEESVTVVYDGPEIEIGFNAGYLIDFLRAVPEERITFLFKDGVSAGEMRPAGDDINYTFRYIVMPMRI